MKNFSDRQDLLRKGAYSTQTTTQPHGIVALLDMLVFWYMYRYTGTTGAVCDFSERTVARECPPIYTLELPGEGGMLSMAYKHCTALPVQLAKCREHESCASI